MARRRYRRYKRRRSGRWSPNIVKIGSQINTAVGEWFYSETLAVNNIPTGDGVTIPFTVKNFEVSFVIDQSNLNFAGFVDNITAYIMYVPQGMSPTAGYFQQHPEYIMAYKFLGTPSVLVESTSTVQQQYQPYRIRTRMSRKLQTGDSVILYIQGSSSTEAPVPINIDGIVRWWSKAN